MSVEMAKNIVATEATLPKPPALVCQERLNEFLGDRPKRGIVLQGPENGSIGRNAGDKTIILNSTVLDPTDKNSSIDVSILETNVTGPSNHATRSLYLTVSAQGQVINLSIDELNIQGVDDTHSQTPVDSDSFALYTPILNKALQWANLAAKEEERGINRVNSASHNIEPILGFDSFTLPSTKESSSSALSSQAPR